MKQTYETTISPPRETTQKSGIAGGVLIGTLMMGFGLLAAFAPVATGLSLAYVITAGLGIYGATQLAAWVRRAPAAQRLDAGQRHSSDGLQPVHPLVRSADQLRHRGHDLGAGNGGGLLHSPHGHRAVFHL